MNPRASWRAQLGALDLAQPWWKPYRASLAACRREVQNNTGAAGALAASGSPAIALSAGTLRFVPADNAPPREAYEAFIARTACVPTRDNLHDFLNGVVWQTFPQTKRRLNELQAAEIVRTGIGASRGALRDALTLFDENGAVLDAPPALWDALLARDWQRLFVAERALWREARLLVFGHALLEKLVSARKATTAHVLLAQGTTYSVANDDASMAEMLDPAHLQSKPFVPLPLLGVPGWWPGNEDISFYDDSDVFRPPRA